MQITTSEDKPLFVLRPYPLSLFRHLLLGIVMFGASIASTLNNHAGLSILFLLLTIASIAKPAIHIYTNEYRIYKTKITYKSGIISTNEISLPMQRIITTNISYTIPGKIFGYGTVSFSTAAHEKADMVFKNIKYPEEVSKYVTKMKSEMDT